MNKPEEIQEIIDALGLLPHPEGGFYKETYRSEGEISAGELGSGYASSRNYSTAIYFMLTSDAFSAFHRIKQDEFWFFHQGSPIVFHTITATGDYTKKLVGNNLSQGQIPQLLVKGGDWFAAEVLGSDDYALVSCTVSPGFDFEDFELAERKKLAQQFPQHKAIIGQLSRT